MDLTWYRNVVNQGALILGILASCTSFLLFSAADVMGQELHIDSIATWNYPTMSANVSLMMERRDGSLQSNDSVRLFVDGEELPYRIVHHWPRIDTGSVLVFLLHGLQLEDTTALNDLLFQLSDLNLTYTVLSRERDRFVRRVGLMTDPFEFRDSLRTGRWSSQQVVIRNRADVDQIFTGINKPLYFIVPRMTSRYMNPLLIHHTISQTDDDSLKTLFAGTTFRGFINYNTQVIINRDAQILRCFGGASNYDFNFESNSQHFIRKMSMYLRGYSRIEWTSPPKCNGNVRVELTSSKKGAKIDTIIGLPSLRERPVRSTAALIRVGHNDLRERIDTVVEISSDFANDSITGIESPTLTPTWTSARGSKPNSIVLSLSWSRTGNARSIDSIIVRTVQCSTLIQVIHEPNLSSQIYKELSIMNRSQLDTIISDSLYTIRYSGVPDGQVVHADILDPSMGIWTNVGSGTSGTVDFRTEAFLHGQHRLRLRYSNYDTVDRVIRCDAPNFHYAETVASDSLRKYIAVASFLSSAIHDYVEKKVLFNGSTKESRVSDYRDDIFADIAPNGNFAIMADLYNVFKIDLTTLNPKRIHRSSREQFLFDEWNNTGNAVLVSPNSRYIAVHQHPLQTLLIFDSSGVIIDSIRMNIHSFSWLQGSNKLIIRGEKSSRVVDVENLQTLESEHSISSLAELPVYSSRSGKTIASKFLSEGSSDYPLRYEGWIIDSRTLNVKWRIPDNLLRKGFVLYDTLIVSLPYITERTGEGYSVNGYTSVDQWYDYFAHYDAMLSRDRNDTQGKFIVTDRKSGKQSEVIEPALEGGIQRSLLRYDDREVAFTKPDVYDTVYFFRLDGRVEYIDTISMDVYVQSTAPRLQQRVKRIDVGSIPANHCKDTTVTIFCSLGLYPFAIDSFSIEGPQAASFSLLSPLSRSLNPGECLDISIRFLPPADGVYKAWLVLYANTKEYRHVVHFEGRAKPGSVAVIKPRIDLGAVPIKVPLTVRTGNALIARTPVIVDSVRLQGASEYVLNHVTKSDYSVGEHVAISFVFTPTWRLPRFTSLLVYYNSLQSPAHIAVSGSGKQAEFRLDVPTTISQPCSFADTIEVVVRNDGDDEMLLSSVRVEPSKHARPILMQTSHTLPMIVGPKERVVFPYRLIAAERSYRITTVAEAELSLGRETRTSTTLINRGPERMRSLEPHIFVDPRVQGIVVDTFVTLSVHAEDQDFLHIRTAGAGLSLLGSSDIPLSIGSQNVVVPLRIVRRGAYPHHFALHCYLASCQGGVVIPVVMDTVMPLQPDIDPVPDPEPIPNPDPDVNPGFHGSAVPTAGYGVIANDTIIVTLQSAKVHFGEILRLQPSIEIPASVSGRVRGPATFSVCYKHNDILAFHDDAKQRTIQRSDSSCTILETHDLFVVTAAHDTSFVIVPSVDIQTDVPVTIQRAVFEIEKSTHASSSYDQRLAQHLIVAGRDGEYLIEGDANISVTDVLGRFVGRISRLNAKLVLVDLSQQPSGVYFIMMQDNTSILSGVVTR